MSQDTGASYLALPNDPATESILQLYERTVNINHLRAVRQAVMHGSDAMKGLLEEIPDSDPDTALQIRAWVATIKLEVALKQWSLNYQEISNEVIDAFVIKVQDLVSKVVSGDLPDPEFLPSRILLSAGQRLYDGQENGQPTDYRKVSREDPNIALHPWYQGDPMIADWYSRGRGTPIPPPLRPVRRPLPLPEPLNAPIPIPARPARPSAKAVPVKVENEVREPPPPVDNAPLATTPPERPSRSSKRRKSPTSRSRSRGRRVKSSAVVTPDVDSEMEETTTPMQRKMKKSRPSTTADDLQHVPAAPLLIRVPPTPSSKAKHESCGSCIKSGRSCIARGAGKACGTCVARKVKCSFTPQDWRSNPLQPKSKATKKPKTEVPITPESEAVDPEPSTEDAFRRSPSRAPSQVPSRAPSRAAVRAELPTEPPPSPVEVSMQPCPTEPPETEEVDLETKLQRSEKQRRELSSRVEDLERELIDMKALVTQISAQSDAHAAILAAHQHQFRNLSSVPHPSTPQPTTQQHPASRDLGLQGPVPEQAAAQHTAPQDDPGAVADPQPAPQHPATQALRHPSLVPNQSAAQQGSSQHLISRYVNPTYLTSEQHNILHPAGPMLNHTADRSIHVTDQIAVPLGNWTPRDGLSSTSSGDGGMTPEHPFLKWMNSAPQRAIETELLNMDMDMTISDGQSY